MWGGESRRAVYSRIGAGIARGMTARAPLGAFASPAPSWTRCPPRGPPHGSHLSCATDCVWWRTGDTASKGTTQKKPLNNLASHVALGHILVATPFFLSHTHSPPCGNSPRALPRGSGHAGVGEEPGAPVLSGMFSASSWVLLCDLFILGLLKGFVAAGRCVVYRAMGLWRVTIYCTSGRPGDQSEWTRPKAFNYPHPSLLTPFVVTWRLLDST